MTVPSGSCVSGSTPWAGINAIATGMARQGYGLLGHLDCRRPRVLSAEERTLLFVYCREHQVAECFTCAGKFRLRELASQDPFGVHLHACPWCRRDLTDSVRVHLYGCVTLPTEILRRAQATREAVQRLVKQSHQPGDAADVLIREAEAALRALRERMRQSANRRVG